VHFSRNFAQRTGIAVKWNFELFWGLSLLRLRDIRHRSSLPPFNHAHMEHAASVFIWSSFKEQGLANRFLAKCMLAAPWWPQ
jgi:hypothetical protein